MTVSESPWIIAALNVLCCIDLTLKNNFKNFVTGHGLDKRSSIPGRPGIPVFSVASRQLV